MIINVLKNKTTEDLVVVKPEASATEPDLTDEKIEEALKYLKYQQGGLEVDNAEKYMGKGDKQICSLVDISEKQFEDIKAARTAKLTPKPEPIE